MAEPPASATSNLPPVYLDNRRVVLQGDPRPNVSKIVTAGGMQPNDVQQVVWLRSQNDPEGKVMGMEDVIDRTQVGAAVYLKCVTQWGSSPTFAGEGGSQTEKERKPKGRMET